MAEGNLVDRGVPREPAYGGHVAAVVGEALRPAALHRVVDVYLHGVRRTRSHEARGHLDLDVAMLAGIHGVRRGRSPAEVLVKRGVQQLAGDVDATARTDRRAGSEVGDIDLQSQRRGPAVVVTHDTVEDEIPRRGRRWGR